MHSLGPPTRHPPVLTPTLVPLIESSTVLSTKGLMAPSIVSNDVVQGETFLPGQIFIFGGFVLRANSLGHLEQIDSYAPGHQVRFGSLNYVEDIRGDLIFDGFETAATAPLHLDEHGLNLSLGRIQEIAPATTLALDPEQIKTSEGGRLNPRGHRVCGVGATRRSLFIRYLHQRNPELVSDIEFRTLRARGYGTRSVIDLQVQRHGHLPTLAHGRPTKLTKKSIPRRRLVAELCSVRPYSG